MDAELSDAMGLDLDRIYLDSIEDDLVGVSTSGPDFA